MKKMSAQDMIHHVITPMFSRIIYPDSNDVYKTQMFADYLVAQSMHALGDNVRKGIVKSLKADYATKINDAATNTTIQLDTQSKMILSCKKTSPRKSFDKDAFIKAVADKYDLKISELITIANGCNKMSAAPVSFTITKV